MMAGLRKFLILALIVSLTPCSTLASWESFSSILCGTGNITETWNGRNATYGKSQWCAPFNKFGGRDGCLKQYSPPQNGEVFYLKSCAEESPSSSYFYPKIRVRYQACNIACWALSADLDWNGSCVMWPIPTIFPMARFCARMAVPADNTTTPATAADPGYTNFKHLNFEGVTTNDPVIQGTDGLSTQIISPKTCAYWDPWALEFLVPNVYFDLFDYNPVKQPFHNTGSIHPIAQMAVNLLKAGLSVSQMCYTMMGTLFKKMDMEFIKKILDFVSKCIQFVGKNVFIALVEEFGQLNHVVYKSLGCVNVPKGPFPPPYWPTYSPTFPSPTLYQICPTYMGYASPSATTLSLITASSTSETPCVTSRLENNFINNAIRIAFDNKIALCPPSQTTGGSCVSINMPAGMTMQVLWSQLQNHNYMIYPCPAAAGEACVTRTPTVNQTPAWPAVPAKCAGASSPCGYRVIFGTQYSSPASPSSASSSPAPSGPPSTIPSTAYDSTLSDCPNTSDICQTIWGIDNGNFTDIALQFAPGSAVGNPQVETSYNEAMLYYNGDNARLNDSLRTSHQFTLAIARSSPLNDSAATTLGLPSQDPSQICVYETGDPTLDPPTLLSVINCVPRAPAPAPTLIECGSGNPADHTSGACASRNNHFSPTMIVQLQVGSSAIQGPLTALSVPAHLPPGALTSLNLAGVEYTSIVTDNSFIVSSSFAKLANTGTISPAPSVNSSTKLGTASNGSSFTYSAFPSMPSINSGTKFGSYKPNSSTLLPSSTMPFYVINPTYAGGGAYTEANNILVPTGAQYLNGLEYIQNQYLVGGTNHCLNVPITDTCPSNVRNCVLTTLLNKDVIDCKTFATQVTSVYHGISPCRTPPPGVSCTAYQTINGATAGSVTIQQCGSGTPCNTSSSGNASASSASSYCCYSYTSSTTSGPLCTPSLAPADRVYPLAPSPAGSNPILTANQYYQPNTPLNADAAKAIINPTVTASPPTRQMCRSYIQNVSDLTNSATKPYATAQPCTAAQLGSGYLTEQFVSTNPSQVLRIYDNYNVAASTHNYCYNPVQSPADPLSCIMNTSSTSRLDRSGVPRSTTSLTCPLACGTFIGLLGNNNYSNIQPCAAGIGGLSTVETLTDSSQTPALVVNIEQYITSRVDSSGSLISSVGYCYSRPAGGSSCNLSCTATQRSRPSSMLCSTYLSLVDSKYAGLASCNNVTNTSCPTDMVAYAAQNGFSRSTCNSTSPSCTTGVTITSSTPASPITTRTCTSNLTFTNTGANIGCIDYSDAACQPGAPYSITTINGILTACQCGITTSNLQASLCSLKGNSSCPATPLLSPSPVTTTTTKTYSCYNYNGDSTTSTCTVNTSASNPSLPALSLPSSITGLVTNPAPTPVAPPATNPGAPPTSIDQNTQGVRTKTPVELGLCVQVAPPPGCAAITSASSSTGYATWPAAAAGTQSTGVCMSGHAPKVSGSMLRYCFIADQTAVLPITASFEPITSSIGCVPWIASFDFNDKRQSSSVSTPSSSGYSYITMWGPNVNPQSQIIQPMTLNVTKWERQTAGFSTSYNSAFWVTTGGSVVSVAPFNVGSCTNVALSSAISCPTSVATILGIPAGSCTGYDITNCLSTGANAIQVTLPAGNASTGHLVFILP
jgi:hypothetical protein